MRQAILLFPRGQDGVALVNRRVAGLPLLDRQIRTLVRAGMEHISVILPEGATPRLRSLSQRLPVQIEMASPDQTPVLAFPKENYLLLLGEYSHHHSSLIEFAQADATKSNTLVAQTSPFPEQKGALRLGTPGFAWTDTSEGPFSTGAFACSPEVLSPQQLCAHNIDPWSLLASVTTSPHWYHSETALWRRIDLRRGPRATKNMLFGQVTKKTSGFVSRHINARISIPTSKILVETGLSPHAITVLLVLTTGLGAAYLVSRADSYATLTLAGLLWQFAAIFDRCDGEVARVKLCESKFGAWFDTVTDNIAYLCAYIGILVGISNLHPQQPIYVYLGLSSIAAMFVTLYIMYSYARKTGSGSLQHYLRALAQEMPEEDKSWVQKLMVRYGFIAKRDFFSFFIFLACLANQLEAIFWFVVTILHLAAAAVLLSQRKMIYSYRLTQRRERQMTAALTLEKRP